MGLLRAWRAPLVRIFIINMNLRKLPGLFLVFRVGPSSRHAEKQLPPITTKPQPKCINPHITLSDDVLIAPEFNRCPITRHAPACSSGYEPEGLARSTGPSQCAPSTQVDRLNSLSVSRLPLLCWCQASCPPVVPPALLVVRYLQASVYYNCLHHSRDFACWPVQSVPSCYRHP